MKGQFLLASRYLTQRKQRMLLTTLAITFGVAVMFGMNALLPGIMQSFRHTMMTAAGKVDINISSNSNNAFPASVLDRVNELDGISLSTGILTRSVQIPAILGGVTDPLTGSAAIVLNGLDLETSGGVHTHQVEEGRFLESGDTEDAVIGYNLARKMDLSIGDTLTIPSADGTADLQVVGILNQFEDASTDQVYVPLLTAQGILNLPDEISTIDILLDPEAVKTEVESALLTTLGAGFKVGGVEVGNELSAMLEMGENIMWMFGIMALAMAAFIILNTFRTLVAERRRDLGMLRAVGASRRSVMQIILTESLIQGIIGTALGLLLGYLLAFGLLKAMSPLISSFLRMETGNPVITTTNLLVSILLGIAFTVGSSYFPARAAMKVTPLEALRPVTLTVEKRNQCRRLVIGLVLMWAAIAGLLLGDLKIISISTLAFLTGLILVTPALVKPLAEIYGKVVNRLYPHQASLAQGNLARQPGRAAVTASAMMIGLAITIGMLGLITSVFDGFINYLDKSLGSDYLMIPASIVLGSGNMGSAPEFVTSLEQIEGIDGVTSLRVASSGSAQADLQVIGIDPLKYPSVAGLEFSKGNEDEAFQALDNERAIIINGILSVSSGAKIGDFLTLDTVEGRQEYRVVGIAMDYLNAKLSTGYISQRNLEQDYHISSDVLIMANRAEDADVEAVDAAMRGAVEDYPAFSLLNGEEFKAEQQKVFSQAMGMMYALVVMLAIPGLIAMANTLGISVIERKREIGMLRAVGSTQKQVKQMIFSESLLLSALGTTLGIVTGLFMSYYLLKALVFSGFKLNFYFPTIGIIAAIFVGLLFGILAAMIPARQAAKTVIVEALRYE